MAYLLGSLAGALITTLLVSRLIRWLLKAMGDSKARVIATAALTYAVAIILQGFGNADGGPWNPGSSWWLYAVGVAFWAVLDWFGILGRASRPKTKPVSLP